MDLVSTRYGLVPVGRVIHCLVTANATAPFGLVPIMAGAEDDPPADPPKDPPKEPETFSKEYVDGLRREAAGYRTKHNELETRFAALEAELSGKKESEKTELEKAAERAASAEAKAEAAERRVRETATRAAVEREARKLSVVDEDVAYRLLDQDKIEYDSAGVPINLETMLKDLVKDKPFLVAADNGGGGKKGVPGSPRGNGTGEKSREQIVAQTKEELAATGKYAL